jgi:hypothetical protein
MICDCHKIPFLGGEITKNELGGAYETYGRKEGCIQDFGGETCGKDTTCKI